MYCNIKKRSPLGQAVDKNETREGQVRKLLDQNGVVQETLKDEDLTHSGNSAVPV